MFATFVQVSVMRDNMNTITTIFQQLWKQIPKQKSRIIFIKKPSHELIIASCTWDQNLMVERDNCIIVDFFS
jgi:hypothetical protein